VANRYDIFRNIDWLKEHAKAKRAKHKHATTTVDYCINTIWQQGRRNDRTLCTVSDEAFALLLLENSFDRLQDIYRLQKGEVTPKRGQKRREFRYTKGGIVDDKTVKNNNPKGWSAEGIKRYIELYAMVKEDRKSNKAFTINWLEERKTNLLDAVQTRKRKRPQQQAQIELLESEADNSENETASTNINGANGTDNESSGDERD
jgi:hypothetical protein